MIELNKIYNEDCLEGMKRIPDGSVDCILTDPPYLYLKNQKLDRPFDEQAFFRECKRVLKKNAFIVLFGRGTSFYRWNTMLSEMGFVFKEEIIWDKRRISSPFLPIHRLHETCSIHTVGNGNIRNVKEPYIERRWFYPQGIKQDISRILSAVNTGGYELRQLINYIEGKAVDNTRAKSSFNVTGSNQRKLLPAVDIYKRICNGITMSDIIQAFEPNKGRIHPTQKPIRLIEILMELTSDERNTVLDPFSGSGSTAIAALNTGRHFIGFEIDKEYYDLSISRIREHQPKLAL